MFTTKPLPKEVSKKHESYTLSIDTEISLSDGPSRTCVVNKKYAKKYAERIKNFKVYDDDVWVVTFMKCGTTWAQEMIWMINNNLDYEMGLTKKLDKRFPFIDVGAVLNMHYDSVKVCEKLKRPRHIKTHLPLFLLPNELWTVKPKIIYVARNPKDAAVSCFHHYRHIQGYKGNMREFIDLFLRDLILCSPFNDHILDFWKIRHESNILFIFYEDMKRNLEGIVKQAIGFMGKSYTQEQIEKLCQHLSFESMKNNPSINAESMMKMRNFFSPRELKNENFKFIRKGEVGGFKDELTSDEIAKFDEFIKHPEFEKHDFQYKM